MASSTTTAELGAGRTPDPVHVGMVPGGAAVGPGHPAETAAAVRAGPGEMPVFGAGEIPDDELDDLVAYVQYLRDPEDPGGLPLGRIGPVPEGFVAWTVGVTLMLGCVFWIGTRSPIRRRRTP